MFLGAGIPGFVRNKVILSMFCLSLAVNYQADEEEDDEQYN